MVQHDDAFARFEQGFDAALITFGWVAVAAGHVRPGTVALHAGHVVEQHGIVVRDVLRLQDDLGRRLLNQGELDITAFLEHCEKGIVVVGVAFAHEQG